MDNLQRIRNWKKGFVFVVLCIAAICFPLYAKAKGTDEEVTIYGLGSTYLEKISIPDNRPQSYQITIANAKNLTYSVASGDSAKVSADGLITPKYSYWKRHSNYNSSVSEDEEYDYYTMDSGDTKIIAKAADRTYTITVHVKDYAITYGDEIMDAYLSEHVTDDMTDAEIMEAIAKFPASYDYSASHSGVYSMIIFGGGDCWASTHAIIKLCEKMGIKAWARNGNKDAGAGSGHKNAMAELNGIYYEIEAGYSMSKTNGYRPYSIGKRTTLYSYYNTEDGLKIYQYDGYDTTGVLEIPETIDGKTVTNIAEGAFSGTEFSEIRLPKTLNSIGDFAFSSCSNLTGIEIPASVTFIGRSSFADCTKLTNISIASDNKSYQTIDQVIYSKDGKTLVTCPNAGQVRIPDTVTKIADYAFYFNSNLQHITIPESVEEMGEGAFGNCGKLSSVMVEGNGLKTIGTHCFRSNTSLVVIRIPASVTSLGAYAFGYCTQLKHIYFSGDAPKFGSTIDDTFYDRVFYSCTANAYYPEENATWTEDVLKDHDGTITWSVWSNTKLDSIEDAELSLEQDSYIFTGKEITPKVTLMLDGKKLILDKDYAVSYTDNVIAGTAIVTVTGIGSYSGEISKNFVIEKAEREISIYTKENHIKEQDTMELNIWPKENYSYTSDNPSVATVDENGVISGIANGKAVITVHLGETENYKAASADVTITVTHDMEHVVVIDDTVTDGKVKVQCQYCHEIYMATVPTDFTTYWYYENSGVESTYCDPNKKKGDILVASCYDNTNADLSEIEIVSQNEDVVTVTDKRFLNFIADGVAKVVVRPKYNPSIGKVYTFYVGNVNPDKEEEDSKSDTGNVTSGKEDEDSESDTQNGTSDKKENPSDNGKKINYYDSKKGIKVSVIKGNKESATLVAVDKKKKNYSLVIPDSIKVDGKNYNITSIAKGVFKNDKKITKVTIGKNVKTIGKEAFYGCKNLKTITIKTTKLSKKNVGSNAFKGIYAKASITVPKSKLKVYKSLLKERGVGAKAKIKS